jgi:hypothetical protein
MALVGCRLGGHQRRTVQRRNAASQGGTALTLCMDALATRHTQLRASSHSSPAVCRCIQYEYVQITQPMSPPPLSGLVSDSGPLSNCNREGPTDSRPSRQTRSDRPITTTARFDPLLFLQSSPFITRRAYRLSGWLRHHVHLSLQTPRPGVRAGPRGPRTRPGDQETTCPHRRVPSNHLGSGSPASYDAPC